MDKYQNRICVFCGSAYGNDPVYIEVAYRLGISIASAGIGLVYGGGENGLMGVIAKAVKKSGGHVTGIMPSSLVEKETAFYEIDAYHQVDHFHERKALMSSLSDAFICLPGGPGTLEEIIEQLALKSKNAHIKPIILINTNGYWESFLDMIEYINNAKTGSFDNKVKLTVVNEPETAVKNYLEKRLN